MPPSLGGPLVDEAGVVHALYMSFAYEEDREILQQELAMPAAVIREALRLHQSASAYRSLDARLSYRPLAEASQLGLPDEWLNRYNALPAELRRVLYLEQIIPDTDAAEKLMAGDVLLAIDGELVADLFTAERLSQRPSIELTVLRDESVETLTLEPSEVDALGTQRLVSWAGALFQEPHPAIGLQKGVSFPGVYIAHTTSGSPALWDGLFRNRFVVAIDGKPVNDLDDFLERVREKSQDDITRLSVVSMSGRKRIVTVQPEYNFWPTFELKRGEGGWQRSNALN